MSNGAARQPIPEFAEVATYFFHEIIGDLSRLLIEETPKRQICFQPLPHLGIISDPTEPFR